MDLLKENLQKGFKELNFVGEAEVLFNYSKSKEVLRYEVTLDRQFPSNLYALCIYDPSRLDEEQFIQLNKNHDHSIFKGIAVRAR